MGLYGRFVLPWLVHVACGIEPIRRQREKVVPRAWGRVLEIGIGSGRNLPFYDPARVRRVWGLEPSPELRRMAAKAARKAPFEVELLDGEAEEIPLESASVDSIVMTYTLCTVPKTGRALAEMARVLAPGGGLVFCEHGAAPEESVRRWQDRVTPLWRRLAGGCHLNRAIPELIEGAGFEVQRLETMYLPGWRPASFTYWGTAVRAGKSGSASVASG